MARTVKKVGKSCTTSPFKHNSQKGSLNGEEKC